MKNASFCAQFLLANPDIFLLGLKNKVKQANFKKLHMHSAAPFASLKWKAHRFHTVEI